MAPQDNDAPRRRHVFRWIFLLSKQAKCEWLMILPIKSAVRSWRAASKRKMSRPTQEEASHNAVHQNCLIRDRDRSQSHEHAHVAVHAVESFAADPLEQVQGGQLF